MIERVQSELQAAMRGGDRGRVDALRLMLSALQKAAKDRPAGEFTDADAEAVLRRERKQRLEAAEVYREAGHPDRAARLRELSDARGAAHRAAKHGRRERVLVETGDGRGHADDMTAFVVAGAAPGEMVDVVAAGVDGDAVVGVPA